MTKEEQTELLKTIDWDNAPEWLRQLVLWTFPDVSIYPEFSTIECGSCPGCKFSKYESSYTMYRSEYSYCDHEDSGTYSHDKIPADCPLRKSPTLVYSYAGPPMMQGDS